MTDQNKTILVVFGTRPEAIKMAPVVHALRELDNVNTLVCTTGQHQQMVDDALAIFDIIPDIDLRCMVDGQSLTDLSSNIIKEVGKIIETVLPDMVLVHGDTATTLGAALGAFYHRIKIGHVEAGLRTGNMLSPWPEEGNRVLVSKLAEINFAPTSESAENLISEGINKSKILETGNTVIDALIFVKNLIESNGEIKSRLKRQLPLLNFNRRYVLITCHRRENFGEGIKSIITAIKHLAQMNADIQFVLPVHLNPLVRIPIEEELNSLDNVLLIPPQEYMPFIHLMMNAFLILTDSGGIQEEAPALGTPVLLMRNTTERPEAIKAGCVVMVGSKEQDIIENVNRVLLGEHSFSSFDIQDNPYGRGDAAVQIADWVSNNV